MAATTGTTYIIDDVCYDADDPCFQEALAEVYALRLRPLCMCRPEGLPMYVAKAGGRFMVKRMPMTGRAHGSGCGSYEAPDELGGLGQLRGAAIQEDPDEGVTILNLGFPFTKGAARKAPTPGESPADTVKVDKARLSLLATLHYLWREAELTRWSPGMAGKRFWGLVRRQLLGAADGARAKGQPLSERLYVPEPFSVDHKLEISARRTGMLAKLMTAGPAKQRPLMLLVGEVKALEAARYDVRVVVKHCPDFSFFLSEEAHQRLTKRFEREVATWNGLPDSHLLMIALFSVPPSGFAQVEEAALMLTDEHWLPIDGGLDLALISELVRERRVFERGLRFNMAPTKPLAIAVLQDTNPKPTAMLIQPAGAPEAYTDALASLIEGQAEHLDAWVWTAEAGAMPALPPHVPMNAARRATVRPVYLLLHEDPSLPTKLVSLTSPRRLERPGEAPRLVVRVLEEFAELRHLPPEGLQLIGRPVHVRPESLDATFRRVSPEDAERLRAEDLQVAGQMRAAARAPEPV